MYRECQLLRLLRSPWLQIASLFLSLCLLAHLFGFGRNTKSGEEVKEEEVCIHRENSSDILYHCHIVRHCILTLLLQVCACRQPSITQRGTVLKGNLIPEYIEEQQSPGWKQNTTLLRRKQASESNTHVALNLQSVSSERKDCGKALDGYFTESWLQPEPGKENCTLWWRTSSTTATGWLLPTERFKENNIHTKDIINLLLLRCRQRRTAVLVTHSGLLQLLHRQWKQILWRAAWVILYAWMHFPWLIKRYV